MLISVMMILLSILCLVSCKTIGAADERSQVLSDVGDSVTLRCISPTPWFFCVWEGPRGGRVCGLRDKLDSEGHQALCGADQRLNITGESRLILKHHRDRRDTIH